MPNTATFDLARYQALYEQYDALRQRYRLTLFKRITAIIGAITACMLAMITALTLPHIMQGSFDSSMINTGLSGAVLTAIGITLLATGIAAVVWFIQHRRFQAHHPEHIIESMSAMIATDLRHRYDVEVDYFDTAADATESWHEQLIGTLDGNLISPNIAVSTKGQTFIFRSIRLIDGRPTLTPDL